MRFIISTIQHTGTKFLYNLFPGGFTHYSFTEGVESENALYVGHITPDSIDNILNLNYQMLIPLRHPYLVAESWIRRGKPLSDLAENFRLLANELDLLNPLYLPIDVENRQDYLDLINDEVGLNFKTDWSVANSKKNTYNLSYKDLSPEPIMIDLVKELEDFVARFY